MREYVSTLAGIALLVSAGLSTPGANAQQTPGSPDSIAGLTDTIITVQTDSLYIQAGMNGEYPEIEEAQLNIEALEATLDTLRLYTCPYQLPYSMSYSAGNWKRLWLNTTVLTGAYVATLGVLQCLPEDATAWNRAELQRRAPFNRWWRNVMVLGPEWDHDKFVFNYILHPYAGAAYFMGARSLGFNFYQSMLYSFMISTIGWEFGIEAFMERPSYQDLFITPVVGSLVGEGFYKLKRHIVANDYRLFGSPVLGNIVAVLIDPVNEIIGFFAGNDARSPQLRHPDLASENLRPHRQRGSAIELTSSWWKTSEGTGMSITCHF